MCLCLVLAVLGISVKDVMVRDVITARPVETIASVVKKLVAADVGGLVIIEDGKPVGIITRGDVLKAIVNKVNISRARAKSIMTSPVVTARPEEDIEDIAKKMRNKKVKRIPVVDNNNNLVGIVSQTDIISISPAIYEIVRERASMEAFDG